MNMTKQNLCCWYRNDLLMKHQLQSEYDPILLLLEYFALKVLKPEIHVLLMWLYKCYLECCYDFC